MIQHRLWAHELSRAYRDKLVAAATSASSSASKTLSKFDSDVLAVMESTVGREGVAAWEEQTRAGLPTLYGDFAGGDDGFYSKLDMSYVPYYNCFDHLNLRCCCCSCNVILLYTRMRRSRSTPRSA